MGKGHAQTHSKEDIHAASKHIKKLNIITIREMEIKTVTRCHLTPLRMSIIKKTKNNRCWQQFREKGNLIPFWWEFKLV